MAIQPEVFPRAGQGIQVILEMGQYPAHALSSPKVTVSGFPPLPLRHPVFPDSEVLHLLCSIPPSQSTHILECYSVSHMTWDMRSLN